MQNLVTPTCTGLVKINVSYRGGYSGTSVIIVHQLIERCPLFIGVSIIVCCVPI